jgi:TPR repeat protein
MSYAAGFKESLAELKALNPQLNADDIRKVRYSLGQMYREGRGSAPDRVAAYSWFTLAEAAGDRPSVERKRELKAQMTPLEIDMATRRANTWLKRKQLSGVPAPQP